MGLVRVSESACSGCRVPLRWRAIGLGRSTMGCYVWCYVHHYWDDCMLNSTYHEHLHRYVQLFIRCQFHLLTTISWHGPCWSWRRNQRADCLGCDVRDRPNLKAWKIRRSSHLHYFSILSLCPLGPTHCLSLYMALCWSPLRCLVIHWSCSDIRLLPSTPTRELYRPHQPRDPRPS